ncbi:MAG: hypothetical protein JJ864_04800 [Rhizobiaceae bacterium]|nr:hypothetical protein [Rhizobiaceae bacterium]
MKIITAARAALAALFAGCVALAATTAASAGDVTFLMNNHHEFAVEVELYSQDRNHVWPGNGQVFYLDDGETRAMPLSCEEGETICYGAWVSGDPGTYWGVGPGDVDGCDNCCYVCQGGMTEEINLIE